MKKKIQKTLESQLETLTLEELITELHGKPADTVRTLQMLGVPSESEIDKRGAQLHNLDCPCHWCILFRAVIRRADELTDHELQAVAKVWAFATSRALRVKA